MEYKATIMAPLNVLTLGGSRNIGYFSSVRLLDAGCTVTFLLRDTAIFDTDETIHKYLKSGKAFLCKGDALVQGDVKRAWEESASHGLEGKVDLLLFTVGGKPSIDIRRGAVIKPHNLVTQCFLNAVCTMPPPSNQSYPRIVTISSTGLTHNAHDALPLLLKPLYGWLLNMPHQDKLGAERIIAHVCNWEWDPKDGPAEKKNILPQGWQDFPELPPKGSLSGNVLVVRPALLTDGECVADKNAMKKQDKPPYRVKDVNEGEISGYTVSRKDVGHFVAQAVLEKWEEFGGKIVNIAN
ncbi:hypothetical protein D9758_005599 [Tetrapyrgos nigripes]|uniref:NAD(P)-binding domain-containing protein n=1 Tax=Tetrapyrgos nigripes TaxID=182062 RepID=A0A8H5GH35_9AGAR|nr:hypothetical protein D9758_005599 [Tetrapyrgos nigripes]